MSGTKDKHTRLIDKQTEGLGLSQTTAAWAQVKRFYTPEVARAVDAIVAQGGVSYLDIVSMNMAQYMDMLENVGEKGYPVRETNERMVAISKHLRVLTEKMGGTKVGQRRVFVPEGVRGMSSADVNPEVDLMN